jgi:hypothetical protein
MSSIIPSSACFLLITTRADFSSTWNNNWAGILDESRIHKLTITLRFLGIILRVFTFEVFIYNVYINKFQPIFSQGGGGGVIPVWLWITRRKTVKNFVPSTFKNSVLGFGETIDSWNWVGIKYGFESAMSHKMCIFKAGIDFSFLSRQLPFCLRVGNVLPID